MLLVAGFLAFDTYIVDTLLFTRRWPTGRSPSLLFIVNDSLSKHNQIFQYFLYQ